MQQLSQHICVFALIALPFLLHADEKYKILEECSATIPFTDLTPEISRQLSWGELPNVAIEVKEGSEFPTKLFAKFGFCAAKQDPSFHLNMERTCYFRFVHAGPSKIKTYISYDLHNWQKSKPQRKGIAILQADENRESSSQG